MKQDDGGYFGVYSTGPRKFAFWLGFIVRLPIAGVMLVVGLVLMPGSFDEVKKTAAAIALGKLP